MYVSGISVHPDPWEDLKEKNAATLPWNRGSRDWERSANGRLLYEAGLKSQLICAVPEALRLIVLPDSRVSCRVEAMKCVTWNLL